MLSDLDRRDAEKLFQTFRSRIRAEQRYDAAYKAASPFLNDREAPQNIKRRAAAKRYNRTINLVIACEAKIYKRLAKEPT